MSKSEECSQFQTEIQEMQSNWTSCQGLSHQKKITTSWESTSQPVPSSYNKAEKGSDLGRFVMPLSMENWFSGRVKFRLGREDPKCGNL